MRFFFQQSFINSIQKLLKKKSYRDCEAALIKSIFELSDEELYAISESYRLNPSGRNPITKLRVAADKGKSSSYRLYAFVIIKNGNFYMGHLYPKTGPKGQEALSAQEENEVIKSLLKDVKSKNLQEVFLDKQKKKICYCRDKSEVW
ncbi:hypothetical protein JRG66_11770 [Salinimicrobium tongyeongense]|uniref:Uncharacterized protein n=1 Tax=Salinimicrobium tongyeongense TaxID=2809707 RepID=A0ABY6NP23_9FLAO|nr:hypothetical protein [Salinimicrobium tongyeongense]UZH54644.1 hypothetical protein JRG66_11770 [Salinimicrobium tongyeongense]